MLTPMVYPGRPLPEPLPQFNGTAITRQNPRQGKALLDHIENGYRTEKLLRVWVVSSRCVCRRVKHNLL